MVPDGIRYWLLHGGMYTIAGVALRGVNLALLPLMTSLLSPADYGTYDLILVVVNWACILITLEASAGFTTVYCTADVERRPRIAGTVMVGAFIGSMAAVLILVPFSGLLAESLLGGSNSRLIVALSIVAMPLYAISGLAQLLLRNALRPGRAIASQAGSALVASSLGLVLAWAGYGVLGMLVGAIAGWATGLFLAWLGARDLCRLGIDRGELVGMLKFCAPLTLSSIGMSVGQYAERFVVADQLDRDAVGAYGVGARLAGLVGLALIGVQSSVAPLIFSQSRDPAVHRRIAILLELVLSASMVLVCWLTALSDILVGFLATSAYSQAASLVPILALAQLATQLVPFAPGPWLARQSWRLVGVSLTAGVVLPIAAWWLVGRTGLVGAAWANLGVAVSTLAALLFMSQRSFPVPHCWNRLALVVALGCGASTVIMSQSDLAPRLLVATCATVLIMLAGLANLRRFMQRDG